MAADASMRRGVQRRAVEAGRRQVRVTSRWTALRAGRGGGERVQEKGDKTSNATKGGGGGSTEGEIKYPGNWWRQVGLQG